LNTTTSSSDRGRCIQLRLKALELSLCGTAAETFLVLALVEEALQVREGFNQPVKCWRTLVERAGDRERDCERESTRTRKH